MGFVYLMLGLFLWCVAVSVLLWSEKWLKTEYIKLAIKFRWLIFIPISILRSWLAGVVISAPFFFLYNPAGQPISWIASFFMLVYTVSLTIPRAKKIIPLIICIVTTVLVIVELVLQTWPEEFIARIFQLVANCIFIFVWVRLPQSFFENSSGSTLEEESGC
jgi:hypothetical protein